MIRYSKLSLITVFLVLQSYLPLAPASATTHCYTVNDGVLTDGSLCSGAVNIDESVDAIGNNAFSSNTGITSVTFPITVTQIGEGAFVNTTSLTSITLPSSLSTIGAYAFSGSAFTSITLPSSLTTIGNYAFSDTRLTSLTIPGSVISFGLGAFQNTESLTSVVIEDGVTSIPVQAFYGSALSSVVLPNTLITIGEEAFKDSQLTLLNVPNSVTTIDVSAFGNNSALATVTFGSGLTEIGGYAFYGATGLESITFPRGLTSIGMEAFSNSTELSYVRFLGPPPTLVSQAFFQIGPQAKAVVNPRFYESFTAAVVDQSPSWNELTLEVFNFPSGDSSCLVKTGSTIENGVDCVGAITLPNNVSSIQDEAFFSAESLTSLTFPSTITSIGDRAFESATALSLIRFLGAAPTVGLDAFLNIPTGSIARVDQVHQSTFTLVDGLWNGFILEVVIPPDNNSSNSGNTALNRENERLREEEKKVARSNLVSLAKDSAPLTLDLFNQASIPGVTTKNFAEVSLEISSLPTERRSQLSEILQIARKFEVVDKVASNQKIYSGMLQEVGLIPQDSKNKAALTAALRKLPASERSSYLAIKQAIDAQMTEIQARKGRLASILARLASRKAG